MQAGFGATLEAGLDEYIRKHDPVEKAKRAVRRKEKRLSEENADLCAHRVQETTVTRIPLTAEQKHEVFLRDEGRCTFVQENGKRCNSDRWLAVHHVREVQYGGSNDAGNLTTLCSFHHDEVHQLSFAAEGEMNRLRSPVVRYG